MTDFTQRYCDMVQTAAREGGTISVEILGVTVTRYFRPGMPLSEAAALMDGAANELEARLVAVDPRRPG